MIKCKHCSFENEDSSKYCKNCGELLENKGLTKALFNSMPRKNNSEFFSGKRVKIISGAIALVLVILVGINMFSSDPTTRVMMGFYQFISDDSKEITAHVKLDDYAGFGADIIEDISFNLYLAKKREQFGGAIEMTYDEQLLYYPKIESKEDQVFFDILGDSDEIFYYEDDKIEEFFASSNMLSKYIGDIEIDSINHRKYIDIIDNELDDNIYEEKGKVVLELDLEEALIILDELIDELKDDDPVIEELHEELVTMFTQMVEDDFEFSIDGERIDEDVIEDILDDMKDYDDFEDGFIDGLEDMQEEIEYTQEYTSDFLKGIEIKLTFDFTITNKIKEMVLEFDGFNGVGDFEMQLDLTKGYAFNKYDASKAEEIDPDDYKEMEEIEEDILELISDRIDKNEELNEDLESYGMDNIDELIYELMWSF